MGPDLILLAVALALWAAGWVLFGGEESPADPAGSAGAAAATGRPYPAVSIIVPARNEEQNLPVLLQSINGQPVRPAEVIVVDDGSTDTTAEVAQQLGARVIASRPLPDGWRGKTWACQQGAQAATGAWLLFVDADTWFEPGGLARVLGRYQGGAFSVGPYHAVRKPYEELSAFFNLVMAAATVPRGLFGQLLLVDRDSYWRVGGHETVKGRILENCWLAEQFRAAGIPVRSGTGRRVFSFRMYPNGLRELVDGWTKGFASGAGRTPLALRLLIVAWMAGLMLGSLLLPSGWGGPAVYLLYVLQLRRALCRAGAFHWSTALVYPVPLLFFFAVFARSVWRPGRRVTWKGRIIRAD